MLLCHTGTMKPQPNCSCAGIDKDKYIEATEVQAPQNSNNLTREQFTCKNAICMA